MLVPTTSEGSRSEVNWMRWNEQWKEFASGLRQRRLAHAGHIFDEQVALGEQRHDREADDFILSANDTRNRILQLRDLVGRGCGHWLKIPGASVTNEPRVRAVLAARLEKVRAVLAARLEKVRAVLAAHRSKVGSWAISSVVRALASHARGPRFKSLIAHHARFGRIPQQES